MHHNKASYLVIPNLYSADPNDKEESAKGMAVNQLAGVLSDLDLVRWPKGGKWWLFRENELKKLKNEESLASDTDLTEIRKKWAEDQGMTGEEAKEYARQARRPQSRTVLESRTRACKLPAGASRLATTSRSSRWSIPRA